LPESRKALDVKKWTKQQNKTVQYIDLKCIAAQVREKKRGWERWSFRSRKWLLVNYLNNWPLRDDPLSFGPKFLNANILSLE